MTDTIFARATAAGRAAVAIVRISGADTARAVSNLVGALPAPRVASVRSLRAENGDLIDQALVIWMPGPRSFTGEDCAELQVHGGVVVLDELASALKQQGLREAVPGEFSRRAFEHGKLDLLQAEALADLVDAQTSAQKRQALSQMAGAGSRDYRRWRTTLVQALALLEAENDFPDEGLPGGLAGQAGELLRGVGTEVSAALTASTRSRRVRSGYRIALVGAPNAGKSSLFNALVGRNAVIVSPHPGTTRDVVEAELDIAGYAVTLADMAGLRHTSDPIEDEGIRRANEWADSADLRLVLVDHSDPAALDHVHDLVRSSDTIVYTKADQGCGAAPIGAYDYVTSSVVASEGLVELEQYLAKRIVAELGAGDSTTVTRDRHLDALTIAAGHIVKAQETAIFAPELAEVELKAALASLEAILGAVRNEDVLDSVFSSFCIGK